jgi:hypothetical protein
VAEHPERKGPVGVAAAMAATASLAGLLAVHLGVPLILAQDGNYALRDMMGSVVQGATQTVGLFALGAFAVLAAGWVWRRVSWDFHLFRVWGAALAGAGLGALLGTIVMAFTGPVVPIDCPVGLAGGWAGYWQARTLHQKPSRLRQRAELALAVTMALTLGLWLLAPSGGRFPGPSATAQARQQWALATFGPLYATTEAWVRHHPQVLGSLGELTTVAPIAGENQAFSGPGETRVDFTLEAVGTKASAHLRISGSLPDRPVNDAHGLDLTGEMTIAKRSVTLSGYRWRNFGASAGHTVADPHRRRGRP